MAAKKKQEKLMADAEAEQDGGDNKKAKKEKAAQ